ncbi:COX15/CtaA family protein [Magnetospirillum sp. UT-4]|uniref:COX15/CtaA family protein n=1 Tax=Magnetospirillum sp. UT-4 TaxID=2681467 RepID=UPI001384B0E4|nr:COX15/CtaA family protein [Magnetospirillum sp. UT-4]CAA7620665.1 Heme A synthase [Magnetospirillum sp. UT-4]
MRKPSRSVAVWLFAIAAMVAAMVALGGLTRLTGSGLSMVEWQPHHLLPPLTEAEWREAFAAYRTSPQYRLVNAGMDLAGFQGIFWLEYLHRLWGRLMGFAFALPLALFVALGLVRGRLLRRLLLLLALGATQGLLGWLMVASGLVDRPQVSHFRLAAHLLLALGLLAALLWTALDLVAGPPAAGARLRRALAAVLGLAFATMAWGAMVAGLGAGLVNPTFPLMDGGLFPLGGLVLEPPLLNAVATPAAVQYVHRVLALTLVACLTLLALWSGSARVRAAAALAWAQAGLGIATLLGGVPVALAALHQMGAVALLALLVWALHSVRTG